MQRSKGLRDRLSKRQDSEHEQALVRVGFGIFALPTAFFLS